MDIKSFKENGASGKKASDARLKNHIGIFFSQAVKNLN